MGANDMQRDSGAFRGAAGAGAHHGSAGPRLICLMATKQDRADLEALLASTELPAVGTGTTGGRTAILAGPDAAGGILRGTVPVAGPNGHDHATTAPPPGFMAPMMLDAADAASPAMFNGMPPVAASASATTATADDPAAGPFASLATDHDRRVLAGLTRRESEIAQFVGQGLNVEEIAERLRREKTTVISHRRSLLRKIGCRDALGIARFAYRVGLATP